MYHALTYSCTRTCSHNTIASTRSACGIYLLLTTAGTIANPTTFNLKPISNMEFKLCRVTMQNLANQVLKYTVGKGSPIKLFAAQPSCVLVSDNRLDADVNSY